MTSAPPQANTPGQRLRYGWTTGACAAAAAKAAYTALAGGHFPDPVRITLPKGQTPQFALAEKHLEEACASAAVIKDAGDDPDVTHGALIRATVAPGGGGTGVTFHAGDGVGIVTKAGLPLKVGEPAINPGPRALMTGEIQALARELNGPADVSVTVSVDGGAELAAKTWNPRLGIVGGISILGTTGIVVPYSCSAWVHSIHNGIDVARAEGVDHVAACTGSTSEKTVQELHGLPGHAMLDMGDFAGAVLKYLRRNPIPRVTVAGGFGKISKLAQGHMDLHSKRSQVDLKFLATLARAAGAADGTAAAISAANSAGEVLETARREHVALADAVADRARDVAASVGRGRYAVEVIVVDRAGVVVGRAPFTGR